MDRILCSRLPSSCTSTHEEHREGGYERPAQTARGASCTVAARSSRSWLPNSTRARSNSQRSGSRRRMAWYYLCTGGGRELGNESQVTTGGCMGKGQRGGGKAVGAWGGGVVRTRTARVPPREPRKGRLGAGTYRPGCTLTSSCRHGKQDTCVDEHVSTGPLGEGGASAHQ